MKYVTRVESREGINIEVKYFEKVEDADKYVKEIIKRNSTDLFAFGYVKSETHPVY